MKLLIIISILCSSLHAQKLDDTAKKAFAEYYRTWIDLRKEFPNNLGVDVVFVDLNGDGKLDAIATSAGEKYQDGWAWYTFINNGKKDWKEPVAPKQYTEENVITAFPSEFYLYKGKDRLSHVMIMRLVWQSDPLLTGKPVESEYKAVRIEFDAKGTILLKDMPVPSKKELKNYEKLKHETIGK
ncbi:MAG: hypothetical protein ACI9SQ_001410 [Rubritalea sp.]|jgi:hypothetical protein